jgi:tripartite-type tricarboxylate transporter receptor subunit TctC
VFNSNGPLTVQPSLNKTTYNLASFRPLCQVLSYPYVLAVAESSPNSLKEYVAKANSNSTHNVAARIV